MLILTADFFITDILRNISFVLDKIIYGLIETVYALFMEIANITMFSNEFFEEFSGKVYALVGVFMLFKVSFSVLSYIVNPDEFADKSKGMSKLVTNILTSLVLLLAVPFVFTFAMEIQKIILKDDVIPKLFSSTERSIYISSQDPSVGSDMALITFEAFYEYDGEFSSINEVFKGDVNRRNPNGTDYAAEYKFFISTIVGFVVLLLLVSFCFDIALRSIKIGFLQMLAPIPIIGRIDPKKGNELFGKWVKTCVGTYLDLFMRLLAIFFAVYIIKALDVTKVIDPVTGEETGAGFFARAFIVMGALMFAKQLPKLLKELTGLDMGNGTFTLNPFKKLGQVPVIGAATTGFAAMAGGVISGAIAGHEAGHTARGAFQGAMGAAAGLKGKLSMMGAEGKNCGPLGAAFAGSQSGYKAITGKDYAIFNPLKYDIFGHGESEVDGLKKERGILYERQAEFDAELHRLRERYANSLSPDESGISDAERISRINNRNSIMDDIKTISEKRSKLDNSVKKIEKQIAQIENIYHFDDATQADIEEIRAENASYKRSRNSTSTGGYSGGNQTGAPTRQSGGRNQTGTPTRTYYPETPVDGDNGMIE